MSVIRTDSETVELYIPPLHTLAAEENGIIVAGGFPHGQQNCEIKTNSQEKECVTKEIYEVLPQM